MKKKMLSIIIPVYNTENGFAELLSGLSKQVCDSVEVIIVNDGSTNINTLAILDAYRGVFNIIDTDNKGVSFARNYGINRASGEFIVFVDSDDCVSGDYISTILNDIKNNLDLLVYCYYSNKIEMSLSDFKTPDEALLSLFNRGVYNGYLWNKVFKKHILTQHNIRFDCDICYNEDRLFNTRYLLNCQTVGLVRKAIYFYQPNNNGAMAKIHDATYLNKVETEFLAYDRMIDILPKQLTRFALEDAMLRCVYLSGILPKKYVCEKYKKYWKQFKILPYKKSFKTSARRFVESSLLIRRFLLKISRFFGSKQ